MISLTIIISTILFTYFTAKIDADVLEFSYIYSHKSRFMQRLCFVIPICIISISGALGSAFLFYALFDATLNKLRGLDVMYVGNTAAIDKFFNTKPFLYICVKVVTLFSGLYLCLI